MIKVTIKNSVDSKDLNLDAKIVQPVVRDLAQIVYDETQEGADRHTKTGALFQSVYNRQTQTGRTIGHDPGRAPHAVFILFGSRPHKIVPKGGNYSVFKDFQGKVVRKGIPKGGRKRTTLRWAGPGGFVFAKFVNHPGYKGDHYMDRAAETAIRQFDAIVRKHWKE